MNISWAALAPAIILGVGFVVFCLVDIARHDVKHLPKWVWAIICCVSVPVGGVVYLLIGRDSGSSGA